MLDDSYSTYAGEDGQLAPDVNISVGSIVGPDNVQRRPKALLVPKTVILAPELPQQGSAGQYAVLSASIPRDIIPLPTLTQCAHTAV